jgi:DNA-binding response OmpR family regulator
MGDESIKTILVADDEPSIRQLLRKLLSTEYDVVEADTGTAALDIVNKQKIDLVLMDILMPQMDGLSACYAIKQNTATSQIPIVMLTAINHSLNKKLSESVIGADGYITKPFSNTELLFTVKTLLDKHNGTTTPVAA